LSTEHEPPSTVTPAARRLGWPIGAPRPLLVLLDLVGIGFGAATYMQLANPDILLHCLWIVLVLEAFAFGFRIAVVRLAVAFSIVVAYAVVSTADGPIGLSLVDLDLAEWPLMMAIAFLVAVMAERVMVAGERSNRRLLLGQQDERRRIALDLHDGVGQTLAALTYTLDALITTLGQAGSPEGPPEALNTARRARSIANAALDETRDVANRLRPLRLAETGLAAAIEELVAQSAVPVDVVIAPELRSPGLLPQADEAEALRIVQEALGNSIRHARAEHRWIRMETGPADRIVIRVEDDGVGFDVARTRAKGLGMHSMQERAASIHGRLEFTSHGGGGTTVRLEVRRRHRGRVRPIRQSEAVA
jgi:signal transduction histidine kinase